MKANNNHPLGWTTIEQIKAEIERLLNLFPKPNGKILPIDQNAYNLLDDLKIFIDSLMLSENLEKFDGLEDSIIEYLGHVPENDPEHSETLYTYEQMQEIARHFAQWQKEQDKALIERAEDHAKLAGIALGEKEAINKAYKWLEDNVENYVWYGEGDLGICGDFLPDFESAMNR